jgi:hypothetical protein
MHIYLDDGEKLGTARRSGSAFHRGAGRPSLETRPIAADQGTITREARRSDIK